MIEYEFWFSDNWGFIRQRRGPGWLARPEVATRDGWKDGGAFVMDAITGMGEDSHSCGEWAEKWDLPRAEAYAREHGIDLYAENAREVALIAQAYDLARQAHEGQTDKSGHPYFEHPERVAAKLDYCEAKVVALLHDVLEDTSTTEEELRLRFKTGVVDAIVAVTKVRGEDLSAYYARVRSNPCALRVKIADIHDNLEPSRLYELDVMERREKMSKYGRALEELAASPID